MSFPFLQPYAGLSNSLQTAQAAGGPGGAVGGWVELARTTLGAVGDTISVTSLPTKRYYMILQNILDGGGGSNTTWNRLNNDSGTNYARRISNNGGADGTGTSETELKTDAWGGGTNKFFVHYLANKSDEEKLITGQMIDATNVGAGYVPNRTENVFKWANTSNNFSRIDALNQGSGDYASGSEVVVLGWDPDDTHTSNFWEELASVELGSDSAQISSGTISAKKYLWCQVYLQTASNSNDVFVQFNNDTGSNYAHRNSNVFNSDTTGTSQSNARLIDRNGAADQGRFVNFFVINNSANEKLIISHGTEEETSTAAYAPTSAETVAKWTNTSSQITEIDCFTDTGNLRSGAIMKVWGAD